MPVIQKTSPPRTSPAPGTAAERRIHVVQGEFHVTSDPEIVVTTILGSCVAACLRDPVAGVGGMNHFLLPDGDESGAATMRYGVHAMELLVNALLQRGAHRERLEAKLFGGARMLAGLTDIGTQNAAFAERFLLREGIAFTGGSLRGERARRVQFWPVCGRARQMTIEQGGAGVFAAERHIGNASNDSSAIELF